MGIRNCLRICLLFLTCFYVGNSYSQNLDTSKTELNKGQQNKNPYINNQNNIRKSNSSFGQQLRNTIIGNILLYSAVKMVGNYSKEDQLHNPLSKYPYRNPLNGNYSKPRSENTHKNIRFDIEDNFLFSNGTLYGNHLKAKLRPFHYFYFQSEMFQLFEYNNMKRSHDHLLLYNIDFCYDRIRLERFNFGFTIGANYVANEVKKGGVVFGLNIEFFILKPISVYSSIKGSHVYGQPVNSFELQGKYHLKNFYLSFGYQHLKIATPTYDFASLGLGVYL